MSKQRLGFIGLGIMGAPMTRNLLKAGYPVTVYNRNRNRPAVAECIKAGAVAVDSPKAVAQASDVVLMCVTDSADVEQVITAPDGVLPGSRKGMIVIDHSSIMPAVTVRLAGIAAQRGVILLDAPVSGGEVGAMNGTLTIMVGGPQDACDACRDILLAMGKTVTRVGDAGAGQTTKLVNQIMGSVTMAAVAEGLVLGAKCGLDLEKMVQALLGGVARCWNLENKTPNILKGNFNPGFMIKLLVKDLNNVMNTAGETGVSLPVTGQVRTMLLDLMNRGGGDLDYSAMINWLEEKAGVEVRQ